jgi:hypothetical protein
VLTVRFKGSGFTFSTASSPPAFSSLYDTCGKIARIVLFCSEFSTANISSDVKFPLMNFLY